MSHFANTSRDEELEIRTDNAAPKAMPSHNGATVRSKPLTHERVVAVIIRAVRAIHTSFSGLELNGDTNLALDLGLESASRVELLLEVERALDIALDVGTVAVFSELTIAELADLILPKLQDDGVYRLPIT
ncbi:acyl carrier protein [Mycobacterium sp. 1245805.9]|uniref:acyl carrier protein n=1 Tax=Mycobacterium sp. 1245805.9 TaxID=1856862 RepID=UPI00080021BF|nr:phosphopantetheine-binding protein [Mycobacterium sp. 1245805.9]OBI82967.1 hypothetical protein A9X00_06390 [Mycobacterium sp. 1245805.9]